LPESPSLERQVLQQLRLRGYIDGESVKIDWRHYATWDAMRTISADLVHSIPDLIVAFGTPPARAVVQATKTIPIVFVAGEPVGAGLVSTLSHPGGNATGASGNYVEIAAKLLDLVTQLIPGARRIVAVRNPSNPLTLGITEQLEKFAPALRLHILVLDARNADEVARGLVPISKRRADAILFPPDFVFRMETERVLHAVRSTGLPAIYSESAFAEAGGLVSYGPDQEEYVRIAATLVDKILKGANPGELPVEQVSKLKLSINLKTAREMKINIPQSILTRADEIFQ
jgi:putative ABC transport system substrate-binding protein